MAVSYYLYTLEQDRRERKRKEKSLFFALKQHCCLLKSATRWERWAMLQSNKKYFFARKGPSFFALTLQLCLVQSIFAGAAAAAVSLSSFSPSQPLCQTSIWLRHCFLSFFLSLTNTFFAASWAFCMALTDRKISSLFHSMSTMCTLRWIFWNIILSDSILLDYFLLLSIVHWV